MGGFAAYKQPRGNFHASASAITALDALFGDRTNVAMGARFSAHEPGEELFDECDVGSKSDMRRSLAITNAFRCLQQIDTTYLTHFRW